MRPTSPDLGRIVRAALPITILLLPLLVAACGPGSGGGAGY